jgi:hypothetical protein
VNRLATRKFSPDPKFLFHSKKYNVTAGQRFLETGVLSQRDFGANIVCLSEKSQLLVEPASLDYDGPQPGQSILIEDRNRSTLI